MSDNLHSSRPAFPERAVVTGGMPYGNKSLHLGHVGGVFVHADIFARFLRDRIGAENVLFISGTDCYGSPISESYRKAVAAGEFEGDMHAYIRKYHDIQKDVLDRFNISLNQYAASGLPPYGAAHDAYTDIFIRDLYDRGYLSKLSTQQFFDTEHGVFLNGRQVTGRCPIDGCSSEKAYADECGMGHQYMPHELINPVSELSGKRPEMREVSNWYFRLEDFRPQLEAWIRKVEADPASRMFAVKSIKEFLEPPVVYVKKEQMPEVEAMAGTLPAFRVVSEEKKSSDTLVFEKLTDREAACEAMAAQGIRFRTGKTLVPFRLTGNIDWGVPAPDMENTPGLTVWVWPESLWAPISFTRHYLKAKGGSEDAWKQWWCSKNAKVFQFIGEDNVYFYGPAEMAMFMAMQGENPGAEPEEGQLQLPDLVVNNHLLFLNKKMSSSSAIKPPSAAELLDYYTPEQLRAHFMGLGLAIRSVGFQPKPLNPSANPKDQDPVLKEGNLLTNVFNRLARSCFYTAQKYSDCRIPSLPVSPEVVQMCEDALLTFERLMYNREFHLSMNHLDVVIRNFNKEWVGTMKKADEADDTALRLQCLANGFHMLRAGMVMLHPVAPEGTAMLLEYLNLGEDFWSWNKVFDGVQSFIPDPENHTLKFLEPRVDFFRKHESQFEN